MSDNYVPEWLEDEEGSDYLLGGDAPHCDDADGPREYEVIDPAFYESGHDRPVSLDRIRWHQGAELDDDDYSDEDADWVEEEEEEDPIREMIEFANGQHLTIWEDGTTYSQFPDGRNVWVWPDGRTNVELADGRQIFVAPDGGTRTVFPDGRNVWVWPDGRTNLGLPDGRQVWISPEGSATLEFPSQIVQKYELFPDDEDPF